MNGELSFCEFKILEALESAGAADEAFRGAAGDAADEAFAGLVEKGLVEHGAITEEGRCALEPYRVKRAVFIAAGFGSRLVPITLNTPKPLVRVHGRRIIDSLLDAVIAAGVEEIYVVRGYQGEQFDQLLYKYPMVKFLGNPLYSEANNISSLLVAKDLLSSAYVIESDLLLSNPRLITKYQYCSNYLAIPMENSDDWCFEVEGDVITELKVKGKDVWQMAGVSYWSEGDGRKLAEDIPSAFGMPEGKGFYWDEVPLRYFLKHYEVHVRPCTLEDIVEIDTFKELQAIDAAYAQC